METSNKIDEYIMCMMSICVLMNFEVWHNKEALEINNERWSLLRDVTD